MAVTSEWLLALLGLNLVVGMAIGWVARTFVPSAAVRSRSADAAPEPPPPETVDADSLMAEISSKASACSEQMQKYGEELAIAEDPPSSDLIQRIQLAGTEYEESLNEDVARFSDLTMHGDAVLRHVLIELIKHSGQVNKFTKSLTDEITEKIPADVRSVLSLAITELIASNRKLEGELHSARRDIERQREKLVEVQREARIDPLTRIANRRFFSERHESIHARFVRGQDGYAIAVLDLDHFKVLNDTYGHAAGDAALRVFSRILEDCIRKYDFPARIGGEEFAVIMDAAGKKEAMIVAERIRTRTASVKVRYRGQEINYTTSIGVAVANPGDEMESVLHRADAALYAAKNAGRDRVWLSDDEDAPADADIESPELVSAV